LAYHAIASQALEVRLRKNRGVMVGTSESRLERLVGALETFYGLLPSPPRDPFMLFVWEVLSAHSTPQKRDAALAALRRNRALTPDAMWRLPQKKLHDSVALAGPYTDQRLQALRTGVEVFRRSPDLPSLIRGALVRARRALKPLPQLGETGAHRMLLFAADHCVLPVDARVSRVARRLGYGEPHPNFRRYARSIQAALTRELPPSLDTYRRTFLYVSHHGAATCTEADPHCAVCPLAKDCPEGQQRLNDRV
jgi:endonuclease-3